MRFPETSRLGEAPHTRALDDLDRARERQVQLAVVAREAVGSPSEAKAADELGAASVHVGAREAWLAWVERGT